MRITRETDYAIRAVLLLSERPSEFVSAGELHGKLNVPGSFLAKILQKLTRAGILASVRGKSGGFRLMRRPSDISLYDVIYAVQGDVVMNQCALGEEACSRAGICSVHPVWKRLEKMVADELKRETFDTLLGAIDAVDSAST